MNKYLEIGLEKLSKKLDIEFSYTVANFNFELGLPLENALKSFFKPYFPARYGFSSGYLVDKNDSKSNQCDWIIYDAVFFPPLITKTTDSDNVEFFPFDSIYSTIEVKRTLDESVLNKALKQIENSKKLKRTKTSPGDIIPLLSYSSMLNMTQGHKEIFTNYFYSGIYAYQEKKLPDPKQILSILNQYSDFDLLPDFIAVHGKYYITKIQNYSDPSNANAYRMTHLPQQYNGYAIIDSKEKTSALFYARLLNQLNNTLLGSSNFRESVDKVSSAYRLVKPTLFKNKTKEIYNVII